MQGKNILLGCNWITDANVTLGGVTLPVLHYTGSRVQVLPPDVSDGMQSLEEASLTDSVCTVQGTTDRSLNLSVVYPLEVRRLLSLKFQ
jgi:hypothetical protein